MAWTHEWWWIEVIAYLVAVYIAALGLVHPLARRWLEWWHGRGAENQYFAYRCQMCRRLVTHRRIRRGGCGCGGIRISPAVLTYGEKARLLYAPWLGR